jgi:hypothetical protein
MPIYADLVANLGQPHGAAGVQALLAKLPASKGLRKEGGYRASLTFKDDGLYLIFSWDRPHWLFSCSILYPAGVEGFGGFLDPIAGRVPISSPRPSVQRALGAPSRSGGTGNAVGVLTDYFWDRYDFERYHLRFDYESAGGAIRMVSLMSTQLARDLNPDLRDGDA